MDRRSWCENVIIYLSSSESNMWWKCVLTMFASSKRFGKFNRSPVNWTNKMLPYDCYTAIFEQSHACFAAPQFNRMESVSMGLLTFTISFNRSEAYSMPCCVILSPSISFAIATKSPQLPNVSLRHTFIDIEHIHLSVLRHCFRLTISEESRQRMRTMPSNRRRKIRRWTTTKKYRILLTRLSSRKLSIVFALTLSERTFSFPFKFIGFLCARLSFRIKS